MAKREINSILDRFSRFEEVLHNIDKRGAVIEEKVNSLDMRLDKLNGKVERHENFISTLKGKIAIVVSVISIIVTLGVGWISNRING